ncbi:TPA: acyl carrier protein [Campylobacter jejuni]|nr:acyl carrier protein [Campylobacter jejuni]HEB9324655.1 acyl carrier protein [Campylobacter jejuni]HEB9329396.1 acyl carrier protein [Campylobacter jejuni]HEB9422649.1 acyl carrier protein [Campylobacter jejuni]HEC1876999.1 acyl carrier protein [Campylobacter jejuni]
MNKQEMLNALEEILMLDDGSLSEESILGDYEDWDSLAYLSLMTLFDTKLGMNINSEQISTLKTVKDVLKLANIN